MIIDCVNFIKTSLLRDRLFSELCKENDEDYFKLLLHTEVRRFSKGNCIKRVISLWDTASNFYTQKLLIREQIK